MYEVDLIIPVHNEEGSIGKVIDEFYQVLTLNNNRALRFIICEDGSKDNTVEVVCKKQAELPILLLTQKMRKGYSQAVIEGFKKAEASLVSFVDGDGQCDPSDLLQLLDNIKDFDMVLGFRNPRKDSIVRKTMSYAFKLVFRALFAINLKDPSCPYLIIRREALEKILSDNLGILPQGFWWEFNARAISAGLRIKEVPVKHRDRISGKTQVYKWSKIPQIAKVHILGLFKLKKILAATK